jgi:hypothetical protein
MVKSLSDPLMNISAKKQVDISMNKSADESFSLQVNDTPIRKHTKAKIDTPTMDDLITNQGKKYIFPFLKSLHLSKSAKQNGKVLKNHNKKLNIV